VEFHLTAMGRHLPYGITQCYLPPDTSERAPPLGLLVVFVSKPSDLRNDPLRRKTRMTGLSDSERISMIRSAVLIQNTRVTDGRTDGQT